MTQPARKTKHRQIYDYLRDAIRSGDYKQGERFPSEGDLARQFSTSRPTVARAFRDLQSEGMVKRIAGSGTYVSGPQAKTEGSFGLLIPNLGETEVFEPVCAQIGREAQGIGHTLLWGDSTRMVDGEGGRRFAHETSRRYVERKVTGVFLALERLPDEDPGSRELLDTLEEAGIPIVLVDRDIVRYPKRSRHDLVGIDNRRASFMLTQHLLDLGCRDIGFIANHYQGPNVRLRVLGYQEALREAGIEPSPEWVHSGDPADEAFVRQALNRRKVEAVVCVNDGMAALFMNALDGLGVRVPEDLRIVSFDDVKYASLLRSPLTTIHQPFRDIGTAAFSLMMERIKNPNMPARDIYIDAHLVVRKSCGANL